MICAFAMGPVAGVAAELCKVLLKLVLKGTTTAFVGDFANFVVGCSLVLPASIVYYIRKSKKMALLGLTLGTVTVSYTHLDVYKRQVLCRGLDLSSPHIGHSQSRHRSRPLLVQMGRRKGKVHSLHQFFHERLPEDRHAVSQENHLPAEGAKLSGNHIDAHCHLGLNY